MFVRCSWFYKMVGFKWVYKRLVGRGLLLGILETSNKTDLGSTVRKEHIMGTRCGGKKDHFCCCKFWKETSSLTYLSRNTRNSFENFAMWCSLLCRKIGFGLGILMVWRLAAHCKLYAWQDAAMEARHRSICWLFACGLKLELNTS